uniref:Retrotransposon gag domain-containing protein n=1 Tax=Sparus aurata TaxID=8175 RepID=A0A671UQD5_SPAAU
MDSADLEPVRHAIATQGARLDQHSTALQGIQSELQNLSTHMATVQGIMQSSPPGPAPSAPAALSAPATQAAPATTHSAREPWVSPPERYDGNLGQCKTFLMQCGLVFDLQPLTYATEKAKIAYLIGLLRGAALEWASVHWRNQDQITATYTTFTAKMSKVFDHPIQGKDASMRVFSLRQGFRSVAEYAIEFRTLAAESGWNEASQQAAFVNGLSELLKDELVSHPVPEDLDELISLSIRIDNRCRERRREKRRSPGSDVTLRRREDSPVPVSSRPPSSPVPTPEPVQRGEQPEVEPMQRGRSQLSAEERERRRANNTCLYCRQPGHYLATCPSRPLNRRAR